MIFTAQLEDISTFRKPKEHNCTKMSTLSITNIIKLTNYKLQTTKNKFKINRKFEALNFKGLNNFNEFSLQ